MNFNRFPAVLAAILLIGLAAAAVAFQKQPRRLAFNEAQRLLAGETEGNLANQPGRFSRTRLASGQVLELYYPISVRAPGRKSGRAAVAGYGLLYESEGAMKASAEPHHVLEDLIPDGRDFVANIPALTSRLEKRIGAKLDFSPASLRKVDGWLRSYQAGRTTAQTDPKVFQELTAYYGEVLRRQLNAQWKIHDEKVHPGHIQAEPNLAAIVNGRPREIKPWNSVISALYDEDKRGSRLSEYYLGDAGFKQGPGSQ